MSEISVAKVLATVKPSREGKRIIMKKAKHELYVGGTISTRKFIGEINTKGLSHAGRKASNGSFSLSSRRRLRQFLVKHDLPESFKLAVTLTLPNDSLIDFAGPDFIGPLPDWSRLINGNRPSDYGECVRRFGVWFRRHYPNSALVWRNELQTRGLPHTHCIFYISPNDYTAPVSIGELKTEITELILQRLEASNRLWLRPLRYEVLNAWKRCVQQTCFVGSSDDLNAWAKGMAHNRGFDFRLLVNQQHAIRYIVDDLSKHKQEQLGYRGNQWGIVARCNFIEQKLAETTTPAEYVALCRILGKMRRHSVKTRLRYLRRGCPWTTRKRKYHPCESGSCYLLPDTVRRLAAIIQSNQPDKKSPCMDSSKTITQRFPLRYEQAELDLPIKSE